MDITETRSSSPGAATVVTELYAGHALGLVRLAVLLVLVSQGTLSELPVKLVIGNPNGGFPATAWYWRCQGQLRGLSNIAELHEAGRATFRRWLSLY